MIDSGDVPGLTWLNEDRTIFRMPWKHAGRQDYNLEDSKIFMEWAKHSGRYKEGVDKPEPIVWKTRLRCALNKMPDIRELPDLSRLDISDPYRVYELLPSVHKGSEDKIRRRVYKRERVSDSYEMESAPNSKAPRIYTAVKTNTESLLQHPYFTTGEPQLAGVPKVGITRTNSIGVGDSDSAESIEGVKFGVKKVQISAMPPSPMRHLPPSPTPQPAMLPSNWLAALIHCSPTIRSDLHLYNSLCSIASQTVSSENLLHYQNQQVRRLESEKTCWNEMKISLDAKIRILKESELQKDEEIEMLRRKLSTHQKTSESTSSVKSSEPLQPALTIKTEAEEEIYPDQVRANREIYAPKIISNCSSSNSDSGHSESEINPYSSEEIDITC